jgi:hypothetical protein
MTHAALLTLTALVLAPLAELCAADASSGTNDTAGGDRVLVGVNYFAGWWESLPNKWHGKGWTTNKPDWRPRFPDGVPLLGSYNEPATMPGTNLAKAESWRPAEATILASWRQFVMFSVPFHDVPDNRSGKG